LGLTVVADGHRVKGQNRTAGDDTV